MVYVLNKDGKPLMPTNRHGKVKHLLKDEKAKVVKRTPFTIQLLYNATKYKQPVILGVDSGSKTIGISATTTINELYKSEVTLRNDIVELISTRRQNRRTRRNRLRYRKPRFNNRVHSKNKGWLAPSVEHKINSHLKAIQDVHQILPITKIKIEVASFDIQLIKNPLINNLEYQQGPQFNFWNVREYVLFRDGHICQHCKGKSKDHRLNVHHIESRKTGGNASSNLITLCETCHDDYHKGLIKLKIKRGNSFRDAAFMGIMRWAVYNKLKDTYPDVELTYGYITKSKRIASKLDKTHYNDAFCIADNITAIRNNDLFIQVFKRKHNRQIHKANFIKGGKKKLNQAPYNVKGFRLFDKVKYKDQECFIFGRRSTGYFDLRLLDGTIINRNANYKQLELLEKHKTLLKERRSVSSHD
jgi:hypothetical protein